MSTTLRVLDSRAWRPLQAISYRGDFAQRAREEALCPERHRRRERSREAAAVAMHAEVVIERKLSRAVRALSQQKRR
jgi:hypothetical protein